MYFCETSLNDIGKISYINSEIVSADVRVVSKDDEIKSAETDIRDTVSEFLGISTENIEMTFD